MGTQDVDIKGSIPIYPSSIARDHDLTMLYLKNQDLSKLSVSEIAQRYTDTKNEFNNAFKEQRRNHTYYV